MRVAVVAEQLFAPVPGGTGRYTAELLAALSRTAADSDSVSSWVAWHRDTAAARVDGRTPHRLALGRRGLAAAWARNVGPAPRGDVVHAPTPLHPPRRSHPLVVTVHDAVPWTHPETLTPHGSRWHRRMVELAAQHADAIAVPTASVAAELVDAVLGLQPERVHVLGGGVARALQTEPGDELRADVRRRLRLPDRYLVTVATLEPRKGLDVLIDALARLGAAAIPLVVVGQPGWGGIDVPSAARAAGLDPGAVRELGRIDDADLGVVLREAAALVAPSRAEGFGLPLVEAMALGIPVVCSDIPAFVEVTAGAALTAAVGDAAELASALEHVLTDEATRDRLVSLGASRAADFDWDVVARRAWTLYRALAG